MTKYCYLDLETYSTIPIKHGTYAYASKAELLLLCYAIDNHPVTVVDVACGDKIGQEFISLLNDPSVKFVMHNSQFDRVLLSSTTGLHIPVERIIDTMVMAKISSLPASLDDLGAYLGLGRKLHKGKDLINVFCIPKKLRKTGTYTRNKPSDLPSMWIDFKRYAAIDVVLTREIASYLLNSKVITKAFEQMRPFWIVDQKINDTGIKVDVQLASKIIKRMVTAKKIKDDEINQLTVGEIVSPRQTQALTCYLNENYGLSLDNIRAATLEKLIENPEISNEIKKLISLRLDSAKSSIAKCQRILDSVSFGDRVRGAFSFYGAHTGRWAGRLIQPQNMPRPSVNNEILDTEREAFLNDTNNIDREVSLAARDALRGIIIAPTGAKLAIADYNAIEGRVLAWLAGETWKLEAYKAGSDMYKIAYAKAFNIPVDSVNKDQRQIGKVMELALGYQGSVGAFNMMSGGKLNLTDEEILILVKAWRAANTHIRDWWYDLENAAKEAIRRPPGGVYKVGKIALATWRPATNDKTTLLIKLPCGSYLFYRDCQLTDINKIVYHTFNRNKKIYEPVETYGGKLAENITQAVAARVQMAAIRRVSSTGFFRVVSHAHDEIVAECDDTVNENVLAKVMETKEFWMEDLPLKAHAFASKRYTKD